jgi:hypothetical protein
VHIRIVAQMEALIRTGLLEQISTRRKQFFYQSENARFKSDTRRMTNGNGKLVFAGGVLRRLELASD